MRDESFELFIEELGEANISRPVPAERLEKYRRVLSHVSMPKGRQP